MRNRQNQTQEFGDRHGISAILARRITAGPRTDEDEDEEEFREEPSEEEEEEAGAYSRGRISA
ncbi:MAG TPA: hypothetical protein VL625_06635 [Patescibacteria group bacterium]|jgi:hypothetical protein|nr:hypothetical protein [Patescibacteria group bacterium]